MTFRLSPARDNEETPSAFAMQGVGDKFRHLHHSNTVMGLARMFKGKCPKFLAFSGDCFSHSILSRMRNLAPVFFKCAGLVEVGTVVVVVALEAFLLGATGQ